MKTLADVVDQLLEGCVTVKDKQQQLSKMTGRQKLHRKMEIQNKIIDNA